MATKLHEGNESLAPSLHGRSYGSLAALRDFRKRISEKEDRGLVGKTDAEHRPGLRPVAQHAAHYLRLTPAGAQERNTGSLEGDFKGRIHLKRALRPKQQAGLTHVDSLANAPVLLSRQAKTQRKAERDPRCTINLCFGFGRFRQLTTFSAICVPGPVLLPARLIYLARCVKVGCVKLPDNRLDWRKSAPCGKRCQVSKPSLINSLIDQLRCVPPGVVSAPFSIG